MGFLNLSLKEMTKKISKKELTPETVVEHYIRKIEREDPQIHAWSYLNKEGALAVAKKQTIEAERNELRGPLHGIPVGIKDNVDVQGMPTKLGSEVNEENRPASQDALIVKRLKELGAIILGKTHMTEYAWFHPGPTKNPHNFRHTPGGSSSGSAAAVAATMVPVAIGSQTAASVCRPASYCGVSAFKPTYERSADIKPLAPSFDTIGFFGNDFETIALTVTALDERFRKPYVHKSKMKVGVVKDPLYEMTEKNVGKLQGNVIEKLMEETGAEILTVKPPVSFENLIKVHKMVVAYEAACYYKHLLKSEPVKISRELGQLLKNGLAVSNDEYQKALEIINKAKNEFWQDYGHIEFFITTPTSSSAPKGLSYTGDPSFTTPWTVLGGPLSVVPKKSKEELPISIMIASQPYSDHKLLSISSLVEGLLRNNKDFAGC